jgi:hypothetical protein
MYQDRGFRGAGAAVPRKSVMRPFCTTDFPILRSGVASSFPEGLSVACCVRRLEQIEILQLLDKGGVMQLFTLLSRPGKFRVLDGRQNENQDYSRSA